MRKDGREVARTARVRRAPCLDGTGSTAQAVTVRLMGEDPAAVEAVAAALAGMRLFLPTGRAPCRRGPGLRVYGVAVLVREGTDHV